MNNYHDIIDENNNIIGKKHRDDILIKQDLLRFIHVYVFNEYGELLVQQRSGTAKFRPNLLDPSVGGHVDSGEDFEDAAHRELREELGFDARLEYMFDSWGYYGLCKVYKTVVPPSAKFKLNDEETAGAYFSTVEDIQWLMDKFPYLVSTGFIDSMNKYKEYLKSSPQI